MLVTWLYRIYTLVRVYLLASFIHFSHVTTFFSIYNLAVFLEPLDILRSRVSYMYVQAHPSQVQMQESGDFGNNHDGLEEWYMYLGDNELKKRDSGLSISE
jgi:hypothetical protein